MAKWNVFDEMQKNRRARAADWKRKQRALYDEARARRETPGALDEWFRKVWREFTPTEKMNWPYEFYIPRLRDAHHRFIVDVEGSPVAHEFYRSKGYRVYVVPAFNSAALTKAQRLARGVS